MKKVTSLDSDVISKASSCANSTLGFLSLCVKSLSPHLCPDTNRESREGKTKQDYRSKKCGCIIKVSGKEKKKKKEQRKLVRKDERLDLPSVFQEILSSTERWAH